MTAEATPGILGAERSVLATFEVEQDVAATASKHGIRQRTVREILRRHNVGMADLPKAMRAPDGGWLVKLTCRECGDEIHLLSEEEPLPLALKYARTFVRLCDDCGDRATHLEEMKAAEGLHQEWIAGCRMPGPLRELKFEDMVTVGRRATAIEACKLWARGEGPTRGIYLMGETGTGKTRLAATTAWARLYYGPLVWVSVAQLMAQLGKDFKDKDRKQAQEVLTGKGAIVLDDFDKVKPSDHGKNTLFTAIDQRVEAGAPMIVTSNKRMKELGDMFGDPIMSRLAGHCAQFVLDGPDMRLELGA